MNKKTPVPTGDPPPKEIGKQMPIDVGSVDMNQEMWLRGDTVDVLLDALEIMGLYVSGTGLVRGCGAALWPAGSIMDGPGKQNAQPWANVLLRDPLTAADVDNAKEAFRAGATPGKKDSENGNGQSDWTVRPDSAALFEQSYAGNPHPEHPRMTWAV